ncbi:hypothetical protein V6N13_015015 [Hibiscus sabdariffa]
MILSKFWELKALQVLRNILVYLRWWVVIRRLRFVVLKIDFMPVSTIGVLDSYLREVSKVHVLIRVDFWWDDPICPIYFSIGSNFAVGLPLHRNLEWQIKYHKLIATSKLPLIKPSTRKDTGVMGAEMRNVSNLTTHPAGNTASIVVAARLNQSHK